MDNRYFAIEDDLYFEGRWHLNRLCDHSGAELDSREFRYGKFVDVGPPINAKSWKKGRPVAAQPPLQILLDPTRNGVPLDFTFTNADMPVVTSKVADLLGSVAGEDIQRIPVHVESREEKYEIINIVVVIDCIDTERSEIQWFQKGNAVRPDLAGKPEMITRLMIDPRLVGGHHMFRLDGWKTAIIVSDLVRSVLIEANVSGIAFSRVSP